MSELKGIAWNHSRGFVSVVAVAQRFEELHPGVRVNWEKRSLQAFADASMEELAEGYDLIVMDHPHTALAARKGLLLPLEDWLPAEFLADQAANSVGGSHESYRFDGRQWTLATDAAAPIATWRPDLVRRFGIDLPTDWDGLLRLAREGFVSVAFFPIDCLMLLYSMCEALGEGPFEAPDRFAPQDTLIPAIEKLRGLASSCAPDCFGRNPIRTAEFMASSDEKAATYCPFAYGYSNYSRPGYAPNFLRAGDTVRIGDRPLRTTLGGAGLAVSARSSFRREAVDFARFAASGEVQRGLYFDAGGQPGHGSAWQDDRVNEASGGFFRDTLRVLRRAFLRPKHPRYMEFQDAATPVAHEALKGVLAAKDAADRFDEIWVSVQAGDGS